MLKILYIDLYCDYLLVILVELLLESVLESRIWWVLEELVHFWIWLKLQSLQPILLLNLYVSPFQANVSLAFWTLLLMPVS